MFSLNTTTCSVTVPYTTGIDTFLYGVNGHPQTEAITGDVTVTGSRDGAPDTAPQFWIGYTAKDGYVITNPGASPSHFDFYNGDYVRDCISSATGDVTFINSGYPAELGPVSAHWVFAAHEGTTAKGTTIYTDQFGSYTADVIEAKQDSATDFTFTAKVTSSSYLYANVGDTFKWTVHDLGEPGTSDYFTYLPVGGGSIDLPAITSGNIQVDNG
jgi:hypothetical protein